MNATRIPLTSLILLSITILNAHPGIGLVYDGEETIFYTDLKQVWSLNIHTGEEAIAVENVHSHELHLDQEGNLYGEHYWYVEAEQKFKHYIWKRDKAGRVEKIGAYQYGENHHFGFVRDAHFVSYDLQKREGAYELIMRKGDSVNKVGPFELENPTWKYLSKSGDYYFVDYPSLYRIEEGELIRLAEDISASRIPFSTQRDDHQLYGIWTDEKEQVYVAIYGGRVVRKIDANLEISTVCKSPFFWSPVNGVFDQEGNLWLMESTLNGRIRVRKIEESGLGGAYSFVGENILLLISLIILGVLLVKLVGKRRLQKT